MEPVADRLAPLRALWNRLNSDPTATRKKPTSPNWLAIQWEEQGVTIVEARLGTGVEVRRIIEMTWPAAADPGDSPSQAGHALRKELAAHSISSTQAVVIVSREAAVARRLELPAVPDEELPELVRFQAAARTSTPLERLSLDYVPLLSADENLRSVLLVTIDASRLKSIRETMAAAGLQLQAVTMSPLATAELVNQAAAESDRAAASIVVWQKGENVELSLLDQGRLSFSHDIRLPSAEGDAHIQPLQTELNRTLIAMGQSHSGAELDQAYLIPGREADPQVLELLSRRFAQGLHLVDPLQGVNATELSDGERAAGCRAAPAIGELLARQHASLPAVDFLNPRKRIAPPDRRKERMRLLGGAGALLLLVGLWWQQSALTAREQLAETLGQEIADLDGKITEGKPQRDAAQTLRKWQSGDPRPLPGVAALIPYLPDTSRLYFVDLKVTTGTADAAATITGECRAKSAADLDRMLDRLPKSQFRIRTNPYVPGTKDPDYPIQYDLHIDQLRAPQATPAKAGPAVAATGA